MKRLALILGLAAAVVPAYADSEWKNIDFETGEGYKAISVYDCWETSPFRTGVLSLTPQIVANPDLSENEIIQAVPNPSATVAGAQRSRFGSNRFGLRVDFADDNTFELTPQVKYVHVKLHKPVDGRVMLVGLGSRDDVADQDPYVEQFWTVSSNRAESGKWNDMVFAIKGAGGITMRSFVLVPDLESPHNLTSDFLFYIDDIKITDSARPEIVYEYYPCVSDKTTAKLDRSDRYIRAVKIKSSKYGTQTVAVNQGVDKLLYQNYINDMPLIVEAGETVTPEIDYNGTWMHAYCYIDLNRNGHFEVTDDAKGELMAYSRYNADGSSPGQGQAMPKFTVPADLEPGLYRMRFKEDWNNIAPEGNAGDSDGKNHIIDNGGGIVDIMLNVVAPNAVATVNDFQLNGEILAADGSKLSNYQVPAFEPFEVLIAPENGFENNGFTLKCGYGTITPESTNRYDKYGNPEWFEANFRLGQFAQGSDKFTIPGKYMFGNVLLEGRMAEVGTREEYYSVNFDKGLTISRTDRHLDGLNLTPAGGDKQNISLSDNNNPRYVYVEKLDKHIAVFPGKSVDVEVSYTGRSMHAYLYIDYDNNGFFSFDLLSSGVPAEGSELVSYTHYQGHNSKGESVAAGVSEVKEMPSFTVPADLQPGLYRARLKIDWNNANPGGREDYEHDGNKIDENGGAVLDFMIEATDPAGEDSIGEITSDEKVDAYDILGRKVLNPAKGNILIVNGKTTKL